MLRAKLLSTPQVWLTNSPASSPLVGKGLALFAYVATQEKPSPRTKLIDLLWADVPERKAQEYLRSLLYSVRQCIGDYLIVTRQNVSFNRGMPYWLDAEIFTSISHVRVKQDALLLTEALNLYQHDFLDGLQITNAPIFDAWLQEERRQLRDRAIAGWQKLVAFYATQQDYQEGIAANARLLALAPWLEEAHRQQMRFFSATGQRSAALAQYDLCCRCLREELDAPPSKATTALYEQIKTQHGEQAAAETDSVSDRSVAGAAADARLGAPTLPASPAAPAARMHLSFGAMPRPDWFVGRQRELQTLHRWIVSERCRAVSILGMGGQGKTTLAASFVQMLAAPAPDREPAFEGIIWHTVHHAPAPEEILRDWLHQLGDPLVDLPSTRDRQIDRLSSHLRSRRFLFILDNAESVLTAMHNGRSEEYTVYTQIWRLFAESNHQSCLLVTARTWLTQLRNYYEQQGRYRRLFLDGLLAEDGVKLLKQHGLYATEQEYVHLQQTCCGNPLALELVAHTIDELFDGDVHAFLAEESPLLGEANTVLHRQFALLAPIEQELFTWLSIAHEPMTSAQLWQSLVAHPTRREFLMALNNLLHQSLVERQETDYRASNVLAEYARQRLLDEISMELNCHTPLKPVNMLQLNRYQLCGAPAVPGKASGNACLLEALQKRLLHQASRRQAISQLERLRAALCSELETDATINHGYALDNLVQLQRVILEEQCSSDLVA